MKCLLRRLRTETDESNLYAEIYPPHLCADGGRGCGATRQIPMTKSQREGANRRFATVLQFFFNLMTNALSASERGGGGGFADGGRGLRGACCEAPQAIADRASLFAAPALRRQEPSSVSPPHGRAPPRKAGCWRRPRPTAAEPRRARCRVRPQGIRGAACRLSIKSFESWKERRI